MKEKAQKITAVVISLLLFLSLWYSFARMGQRGTDQYWYLAAARSIVELGTARGNTVFPSQAFQGHVIDNPFVHNVPQVYLASIFGFLFDYYWGWSVFNLICVLLTNYFAFLILKRYVPSKLAIWLICLWLFFPLNVWFSFQSNSEGFIALLVTLAAYIYLIDQSKPDIKGKVLLLLIFVALMASRANFLLLIFIAPLLFYNQSKRSLQNGLFMGMAFLFLIGGVILNKYLFPQQSFANVIDALLLYSSDPYNPNMRFFYLLQPTDPDIRLIFKLFPLKVFNAIQTQFFRTELVTLPFYVIFNLIVVFVYYAYWKIRNEILLKTVFLVSVIFIIHFATAVIFQNQVRYLYPYYAVYFISGIISLNFLVKENADWFYKYLRIATIPVLIFFGLITFSLLRKNIVETKLHKAYIERVSKELSFIPESENIWLERQSSIMSYILFPRDVLGTMNSFSDKDLLLLSNNAHVKWLIEPIGSNLSERMNSNGMQFTFVKEVELSMNDSYSSIHRVLKLKE